MHGRSCFQRPLTYTTFEHCRLSQSTRMCLKFRNLLSLIQLASNSDSRRCLYPSLRTNGLIFYDYTAMNVINNLVVPQFSRWYVPKALARLPEVARQPLLDGSLQYVNLTKQHIQIPCFLVIMTCQLLPVTRQL